MNDDRRRPRDHSAMTIEELAAAKGITKPLMAEDFAKFDIFESDEEMEQFIAYTYAARRRDWI